MASQQVLTKLAYERPVISKEKNPFFMLDVMTAVSGKKIVCRQCSSCHGCR